eukprot:1079184-Alexandrium_andersonii.AAC.1
MTADRGEALEALWDSRQEVWPVGWTASEASEATLVNCGRRPVEALEHLRVGSDRIRKAILRAG